MFKFRILSVGLCLTLLLSFFLLPVIPVFAQSLDATEGIVGSTVTISDLEASETYRILWDDAIYKSGTVPSTGIVTFTVPETYGGNHTVKVQNPSGTQVLSSSFTVLPSISIDPDSGFVGDSVEVNGTGFADSESSIKILYDDSSVETGIDADEDGSWSASFTVPDSEAGIHKVDASGSETSASDVADVDFAIDPTITIDPTAGGVGCTVTVNGSGFDGNEKNIKVTFDATSIKSGITADSKGSWSTTFDVPDTYSGNHTIDASGSSTSASDIEDLSFTVESGISIDKTSVYVDDIVAVTGTGFGESETNIYVTFDGTNQGKSVKADATGKWKASLTIPAAINGIHSIDAHGSETDASSITDKTIKILAKITLSPNEGNVGDKVTINGSGFTARKKIAVTFGAVSVLDDISSDSSGSFNGTFDAPKGAGGDLEVTAKDASGASAATTFAMDETAPSQPHVESPASGDAVGFIGKTKVDFEWTEVTDPSGVSYDIQVATDSDFSGIVFEHSGLTTIEYKSTEAEALPQGEYYWRVRAVDGANNASDWVTTQFKSGRISSTTGIIIGVVIVVLFLIVLRIRAIRSKP